jgi:hypothetical protein
VSSEIIMPQLITMDLQATEAAPRNGNPIFDQDSSDMTTAHSALRQDVSFQREGASIAFSSIHWQAKRRARAEQVEALHVHLLL